MNALSNKRQLISVVAVVVCTVGCGHTIAGTAVAHHVDTGLVDLVLPTTEEASAIAGTAMEDPSNGKQFHGGTEILFDGFRDDKDASPFECVGLVAKFQRAVYGKFPIAAAGRILYYSQHRGQNVFSVDASAFQLTSASSAHSLLADFIRQWNGCSGKTVTITNGNDRTTIDWYVSVSDVDSSGAILSATTRWSAPSDHKIPMPEGRAIGVTSDLVVDVTVNMDNDYGPPNPVGTRAVQIAKLMMSKAAGKS